MLQELQYGSLQDRSFGEGADKGICGATADIIVARNLLRMIAAGAAAHSDHARDAVLTFKKMSEGEAGSYGIKGEAKLFSLASEYGILAEGKSREEVAGELANALLTEFGKQNGPLLCTRRARIKAQTLGRARDRTRGIDREIVECMHRTIWEWTMMQPISCCMGCVQGFRTVGEVP
nr:hypothetical protein [Methanosarcina horonobensis]